jgi:hypothetical protein
MVARPRADTSTVEPWSDLSAGACAADPTDAAAPRSKLDPHA